MPAAHDVDMGRSKLIVAIALIVIAVLAAYREFRARRYTEALLNEWLSRNCAIGERGALERELQRYGSRLEPKLEQAFVNGPPADLRTQWLRIEQREQKEVVAARRRDSVGRALAEGRVFESEREVVLGADVSLEI